MMNRDEIEHQEQVDTEAYNEERVHEKRIDLNEKYGDLEVSPTNDSIEAVALKSVFQVCYSNHSLL